MATTPSYGCKSKGQPDLTCCGPTDRIHGPRGVLPGRFKLRFVYASRSDPPSRFLTGNPARRRTHWASAKSQEPQELTIVIS